MRRFEHRTLGDGGGGGGVGSEDGRKQRRLDDEFVRSARVVSGQKDAVTKG